MTNGDVAFRLARVSNALLLKKKRKKSPRTGERMKKVAHKRGKCVRVESATTVKFVKTNMRPECILRARCVACKKFEKKKKKKHVSRDLLLIDLLIGI